MSLYNEKVKSQIEYLKISVLDKTAEIERDLTNLKTLINGDFNLPFNGVIGNSVLTLERLVAELRTLHGVARNLKESDEVRS